MIAISKLGVLRLKGPGNEGSESSGLILQIPQPLKVTYAMLERFTHTDHHGACGSKAEPMRLSMDHQPFVRFALQRADLVADLIIQNFATSAGHRIETRSLQSDEHFRYAHF